MYTYMCVCVYIYSDIYNVNTKRDDLLKYLLNIN